VGCYNGVNRTEFRDSQFLSDVQQTLVSKCFFFRQKRGVTGTQGMKNAQVTAGGVSLDEINPETMASLLFDGLYLAGEVTDVDGPCGGYNLHYAFASALTAAKAISNRI